MSATEAGKATVRFNDTSDTPADEYIIRCVLCIAYVPINFVYILITIKD